MAPVTFNNIVGSKGQTLAEKWKAGGTRTFLGIHSRDFPNLFIMTGPQGGGGVFNFTQNIEEHADYIVWMLKTLRDKNVNIVDVKRDAEEIYAQHCRQADYESRPLRDCFSYYNGEGNAEPGSLAYYGGNGWNKFRQAAQADLMPFEFTTL
jgi:cation diffusion facilitator CzcD-associated flavoprotein CzcO